MQMNRRKMSGNLFDREMKTQLQILVNQAVGLLTLEEIDLFYILFVFLDAPQIFTSLSLKLQSFENDS